ncbi:MAG: hypothetical protein IAF94_09750 [Pirellulaceae bacterium]|nr:hypothetical protein [Pirellulaceae bacterium]
MNWLLWVGVAVMAVAGVYGLHRFCLYLEQRGYLYYWHTKPQGGISPALLDLRELFQPSVRHVIEVKDDTTAETDAEGDEPGPGETGPRKLPQKPGSESPPDFS